MREELIKLLDNAHAPYSKFHVSCILEKKDGKHIPGVNVENSSYGGTICAERNAITTSAIPIKTTEYIEIDPSSTIHIKQDLLN